MGVLLGSRLDILPFLVRIGLMIARYNLCGGCQYFLSGKCNLAPTDAVDKRCPVAGVVSITDFLDRRDFLKTLKKEIF